MKIVINSSWGAFRLTEEVAHILGVSIYNDCPAVRTNPILIQMLEDGQEINNLEVVEIPDACTDYTIIEYDGIEGVAYTINGELRLA